MQKEHYTKEVLLDVIGSYLGLIKRNGVEFPGVTLSDLEASMTAVLRANDYAGRYKELIK